MSERKRVCVWVGDIVCMCVHVWEWKRERERERGSSREQTSRFLPTVFKIYRLILLLDVSNNCFATVKHKDLQYRQLMWYIQLYRHSYIIYNRCFFQALNIQSDWGWNLPFSITQYLSLQYVFIYSHWVGCQQPEVLDVWCQAEQPGSMYSYQIFFRLVANAHYVMHKRA